MEDIQGKKVTENIYLCPDGKYRWIYELNMLKNPVILFTIWKIFGILILIEIAFTFILAVFEGGVSDWITGYLLSPGILFVPGIFFILSIIAYTIVAFMYGWKYMVLFEMDEEGIVHNQMPKQFNKAQGLAWLTTMAGLMTGNFTTAGAGMLSSSKSSSISTFKSVKKIVRKKGYHLINVNEMMEKNQIYAEDADYDFVWNFICARCTSAKIIGN